MEKIKLGIVEDSQLVGKMLQYYFSKDDDFEVEFWADSHKNIPFGQLEDLDIVLCDIGLPEKSGVEITFLIKQENPKTEVVMFTVFEEDDKIFESLKAGASGYLLKNTSLAEIKNGLIEVLHHGATMSPTVAKKVMEHFSLSKKKTKPTNQHNLSSREFDVLTQLLNGHTNKQIAESLSISLDTIKTHIRSIYSKLQLANRAELFNYYNRTRN